MDGVEIGRELERLHQRLTAVEMSMLDIGGRLATVEAFGGPLSAMQADLAEAAADLAALAADIAESAAASAEQAAEAAAEEPEGEGEGEAPEGEGEGEAPDDAAPVIEVLPQRTSFLTRRVGRTG